MKMSKLALGLWNMGDGSFHPLLSPIEGKRIIKSAIKKGITSFDSAFSYKNADNLLSSTIKEMNVERSSIEITTKIMPVPTLKKKFETVKHRLSTEYVDALLLHWPTKETELYKSLKELEETLNKKEAREIGVSNFPLTLLKKVALDFPITIHERPLSLLWSNTWEEEKELGLKTYAYSPLGMGILAKEGDYCFNDSRKNLFIFNEGKDEYKALRDEMYAIKNEYDISYSDIAFSWLMNKNPESIIFGASSESHLDKHIITFPDEVISRLDKLSAKLGQKAPKDNIFSHNYDI